MFFRQQRRPRRDRRPEDEFDTKLLDLARVSHTRAGGKKLRFRAVMVIGDKAAAEDVIGVSDIGVGLQFAATTKISTTSGKSTSQAYKNLSDAFYRTTNTPSLDRGFTESERYRSAPAH